MQSNAAIYARISDDPTGREAGVDRQVNECRELATARGVDVVEVLIDNDLSATTGKRRPGFERILDLIRTSAIDTVVVWHTDRLYRLPRDLEPIIDLVDGRKLRLLTVTASEIDLNTPSGRMVARMLAAASAQEVEHKAERQRAANLDRARRGLRTGGRRAFGYENDGITIRRVEADAISAGYQDLLSGVALAEIARRWNAAGLVTGQTRQARTGAAGEPSPWKATSVRAVLLNPRNAGRVRYRGEIMATPAIWPPVVDQTTFDAAVAVLLNPERRRTGRWPQHLLTGIAECGVCGATVHAGGNARPGVRAYRCSGALGHVARKAEPVEQYVEAVAIARLSQPDAINLLQRHTGVDVDLLRFEAIGIRERLDSLAIDFADGSLTASQLRAASARMQTRLRALEEQLADTGRVNVFGDVVGAEDVGETWRSLSMERRRAILATLMRITLHPPGRGTRAFRPETVGIDWIGAS